MTEPTAVASVRCPTHLSTRWLRTHWPALDHDSIILDLSNCRTFAPVAQAWLIGQCAAYYKDPTRRLFVKLPEDHNSSAMFTASGVVSIIAQLQNLDWKEALVDYDRSPLTGIEPVRTRNITIRQPARGDPPTYLFPYELYDSTRLPFTSRGVVAQSARWRDPYLLSVLNPLLQGHAGQISTHVAQEAALLAIKRPGASLIATAATLTYGALFLTIWDNGTPAAVDFEEVVTPTQRIGPAQATFESDVEIQVTIEGYERGLQAVEFPENAEATQAIMKRLLQKPYPQYGWRSQTFSNRRFLTLANYVLDVFGGELTLLSGKIGARIHRPSAVSPSPEIYRYDASVVRYSDNTSFPGNITSAMIPLPNPMDD